MVERRNADVPSTYRDTTLGSTLGATLAELLNAGEINETTMEAIMHQFDIAVLEKFADLPKNRTTKLSGHSVDYKNVEDIWRFKLDKLEIKDDFFREQVDSCVLLSRTAATNTVEPEVPQQEGRRGQNNRKR